MMILMKKRILLCVIIALLVIFAFIKINTNIYVGDYSYNTRIGIDVQLKIDDKLILNDSLKTGLYPTTFLSKKMRYGFHKINVSSIIADVNQEKTIFLLPNQFIYVEFFPADTLTYLHYQFPDSVFMNEIPLTDSMINQYKLSEELDFPIITEKSSFRIESMFNPFYTE
jgi:hypothetical protein